MVKYDAPLSVLRAFKRRELRKMLDAIAIENFTIRWKWAFRWQVIAKTGSNAPLFSGTIFRTLAANHQFNYEDFKHACYYYKRGVWYGVVHQVS